VCSGSLIGPYFPSKRVEDDDSAVRQERDADKATEGILVNAVFNANAHQALPILANNRPRMSEAASGSYDDSDPERAQMHDLSQRDTPPTHVRKERLAQGADGA
jgi:hypothetical protein